ncbi:MAG: branched-chain alpha-keto acid dehydrogenase subunit E2 [Myxococcales bacterium]|nr:branched-chain alpha-keto acid dehydrogenase subunit E2 [Myxococcales bacterium]
MSQEHINRVPDIGEFEDVEVIEILVSEGDKVAVDQSLVTLESEKATMEIPSEQAGTVTKLHVALGDRVSEGSPLVTVVGEEDSARVEDASEVELAESVPDPQKGRDSESVPDPTQGRDSGSVPDEPTGRATASVPDEPTGRATASVASAPTPVRAEAAPATAPGEGRAAPVARAQASAPSADRAPLPHASPSVRRLARELGVVLADVEGSGRKGRVTKEDVQTFVRGALRTPNRVAPAALPASPEIDFSKFGPVEVEPENKIRRASARNLHRSWITVPHVTQFDEADVTELEAFRREKKPAAEARGTKLTLLAFLLRAVAANLAEFPRMNASLAPDGESLIRKGYFHIGVAVDTENGLIVPVIRDVDQKGIWQLAEELADVSARARARKLSPADLSGGCFSISSLGGIGGTAFTPIVNSPEVGILGVSRSRTAPVFRDGAFEPRLILPLSLSYDHRVIDGALAARFTRALAERLSDIRNLLL